jgi:hypothetical protein
VRHGQAALSGSKTKAPGFAGGYLLLSISKYSLQGLYRRIICAGAARLARNSLPNIAAMIHCSYQRIN